MLEVLLRLFNGLHTALEKTVSYKTREERAQFLRRFFRDLKLKAGYRSLPDPRNFAHRHIQAMVVVWQRERLAPGTIQGYLSYLRALAMWLGKPGLVRRPAHYGLAPDEYRRSGCAERDKSWSAHGVDIEAVIAEVGDYDRRAAASIRLSLAFGMRLKESVMFRPHSCIVPFAATGLPQQEKAADLYADVHHGSKGGRPRWIPVDSEARRAAIRDAQALTAGKDGHLGDPDRDLKQNLRRLAYVMERFGITRRMMGVTNHGLRHECLHGHYELKSGHRSPLRGGVDVPADIDRTARLSVARLAGHGRIRASNAYIGGRRRHASQPTARGTGATQAPVDSSAPTAAEDDPVADDSEANLLSSGPS